MYGPVRTVLWADGGLLASSDPIWSPCLVLIVGVRKLTPTYAAASCQLPALSHREIGFLGLAEDGQQVQRHDLAMEIVDHPAAATFTAA